MAESQNIEYKESWRDEYLKWICGFANAQGGTIFIGVRDDGSIVGVKNAKKLLEDIPNKIQTGLGIIADVNMHTKNGLDYIEIKVEPSSFLLCEKLDSAGKMSRSITFLQMIWMRKVSRFFAERHSKAAG